MGMNQTNFQGYATRRRARPEAPTLPVNPPAPSPAHEKIDAFHRLVWGALIISLPFTAVSAWPEKLKTFGQPAVFLVVFLTALTLASAVLPRGRLFIPRGRSAILIVAFLAIAVLSFFVSYPINPYMWPGHSPWSKSAKQLAQWLVDGAMVYLTVRFVQTWRDFRFALRCCFIGFLCTVGAAVVNIAAVHWPSGKAATLFNLLHNGAWSQQTTRLTLLAYEPSMASDYLLFIIPLLICGSYYWKSRGWILVWSVVGLVLLCGTFSLGSFVALFVAAAVVLIVYARRGSKGLVVALLLLLSVIGIAVINSSKGEQFIGDRINQVIENGLGPSIPNFSTRQRLAGAEAAFNIFLEHPLTGVGVGKSPFYMYATYPVWGLTQGDISQATFGSTSPAGAICFNLFIQTLAEMGLLGGLLFFALLLSMLADCYRALNSAEIWWKRRVFVGILFALVAQVIHYNAMSWLSFRYWFFIWGLAICAPRLLKQKDPRMPSGRVILRTMSSIPSLRGELSKAR